VRRGLLGSACVALGIAAAQSCAPAPTPAIPGVQWEVPGADYLEASLRHEGLPLELLGSSEVAWFENVGRFYEIPIEEGQIPEMLYVHEYTNSAAARDELSRMAPDGQRIMLRDGTDMRIEWLGPPHVYTSGPLIVVHVGNSTVIADALEKYLGQQVAGVAPAIPLPTKGSDGAAGGTNESAGDDGTRESAGDDGAGEVTGDSGGSQSAGDGGAAASGSAGDVSGGASATNDDASGGGP